MAMTTKTAKSAMGAKQGETISGYFRQIIKEKPQLLKKGSNTELYRRWLADHPDAESVPENVKQSLSNLKSVMRSKKRKKTPMSQETALSSRATPKITIPHAQLEQMESRIDDCLALANSISSECLESVTNFMRKARREIVWMMAHE